MSHASLFELINRLPYSDSNGAELERRTLRSLQLYKQLCTKCRLLLQNHVIRRVVIRAPNFKQHRGMQPADAYKS